MEHLQAPLCDSMPQNHVPGVRHSPVPLKVVVRCVSELTGPSGPADPMDEDVPQRSKQAAVEPPAAIARRKQKTAKVAGSKQKQKTAALAANGAAAGVAAGDSKK